MTAKDTLCRVKRRFADSGVNGGFSSSSSSVFSVLIRKSDMVMLSTVRMVRRRFRRTFLKMRRRYFILSTEGPSILAQEDCEAVWIVRIWISNSQLPKYV